MSKPTFIFEALKARHGDCLLLHYGRSDRPRHILIDGGPSRVYREVLKPRLEELRGDRELLRFEMLMVSHIDDDHIRGVLDLMQELRDLAEDHRPMPYRFKTLWHNSFDDLLGNEGEELRVAGVAEVGGDQALASSLDQVKVGDPRADRLTREGRLLVASVPQGRALRLHAEALGLALNRRPGGESSGGLIVAEGGASTFDMGSGLSFTVLGPLRRRVENLQAKWDRELKKKGLAVDPEDSEIEAADYVDSSVFNLASLVVLAELEGRTLLLTGDARGDDVLQGVREAGLLDAGELHVDVMKMPHHGSDRNVATDLFQRIKADHYVFSGDGRHGNPEIATFQMLMAARRADGLPYTLYLTYGLDELDDHYPVAELRRFLDQAREAGHRFELVTPKPGSSGVSLDLLSFAPALEERSEEE